MVSHHSVKVSGVPRYIKDLLLFQGPFQPRENETDCENQSAEGGKPITLRRYSWHHQARGGWLLDRSRGWRSYHPALEERLAEVARCAKASISGWRTKYQLRWDLPRWTTLRMPPDRTQMTPQQMKVHQKVTLQPFRSGGGGASGRRGSVQVAPCAVGTRGRKMSVEAFPLDTKECAPMLPSHCAKRANSKHTNAAPKRARLRVVIWSLRGRVCIGVQGRQVLKSRQITDHRV